MLDPKKDVIVITGGGSKNGLGHSMAQEFWKTRGFSIAILSLDFEWSDEAPDEIKFFECDVNDPVQVQDARAQIMKKFPGKLPTVLINNAGLAHNKQILDLNEQTARNVINVNLLGSFWTVKSFVPDMQRAGYGYVVNVASVLGTVGAAQLSAYCASKAGLIGFHDSMTHEIGNPYKYYKSTAGKADIATLLVTPGHISTGMFEGVNTPSSYFSPVVSVQQVSKAIVDAVNCGETGRLSMPAYTKLMWGAQVCPGFIVEWLRMKSQVDLAMEDFRGRKVK